jgi:hypothetical protein
VRFSKNTDCIRISHGSVEDISKSESNLHTGTSVFNIQSNSINVKGTFTSDAKQSSPLNRLTLC